MRDGCGAETEGIFKLANQPENESKSNIAPIIVVPFSFSTNKAPIIVPTKIERNVPASTIAFPPINSFSWSKVGRMLYLTGPKKAD